MLLYCLSWDNMLEYEDHHITDLGYYTSQIERDKAKIRHLPNKEKNAWPFNKEGKYLEIEFETNKDFFRK